MIDYHKKFRLNGKTAFIIGGAGLIGSEISTALASSGAKTIILDLNKVSGKALEKNISQVGHNAIFKSFNCEDIDNLEEIFSRLLDEFGPIEIFINCSYPRTNDWLDSSFSNITFDSLRKNVDIHMNTYAWLARLAAENMKLNHIVGSIIQVGSIYGILGQDLNIYEGTDMKENMSYSAIKGGITNLTRQMASYYGKNNIRVNTLCPGGLNGHVAGTEDGQNKIFIEQYSKKVPLKRLGNPEEVASAALFLVSDAASYITGTTMMVDGGLTII